MLSLGNMYNSSKGSKYESYAKDSYKFFHHTLHEDPKNINAAIGLGIVCAQRGKTDAAKEIFTKVIFDKFS